uniref:USP domain-containing protein n=2 Tax=Panagrolaimus sp. PS1159 TaxID=55785 RepID=A0AC35G3A4_9BILA
MRIEQDYTGTPETVGEVPSAPVDDPQPSTKLLPIMPPDSDYESIYHPLDQDGHAYVGLVNQAMTCYLNSLIQALFMTPEFRNILYQWQYNGTMEEASKNIPFQLQKLFALLQTTLKPSLETKDLTASFGWEGSDAYEQHDVQELSRVMLEALEHRFRKSEQHRTFIQNLYKGTMEDFVKCLGCKRESVRQDIFNDLALAVREFGATESYKSVEEALSAFIKPELLSGSNKYKCDNCNSYQEAEKGLRFTGLPYLLVIQLKRFTVDYSSGFRVKLNDTMTFPDYLDLNSYIHDPKATPPPPLKPKMSYASAATKKTQPETILENEDFPSLTSKPTIGDSDGWINKPPTCDEVQTMIKKGPYVYELFAIMIHQGSATGGHYFAYIKNLEQSRWLCFNDTNVKAIDLDEVKKSFGGTGWSSNTNAYLMMYRQIDPEKNQNFTRNNELPQHVKNWLQKWEDEETRRENKQKELESMIKVRVLLNDDRILQENSPYGALEQSFSRSSSGKDVVQHFCSRLSEQGILISDVDSAILIPVNSSFNYTDEAEPFDLKAPISELARTFYSDVQFIMELKREDFSLPPRISADASLRTIDILTVDVSYNSVRMCKRMCVYNQETLESIRNRICALIPKCHADDYPCRMVLDSVINDDTPLRLINDYTMTLQNLLTTRFQLSRFYIDCGLPNVLENDRKVEDFTQSQMCKIIEKQKYGIRIRICLPNANDYRQAGLKPPPKIVGPPSASNVTPPESPGKDCGPLSKKLKQLGPLNEIDAIGHSDSYYTPANSSSSQIVMSSNQPNNSMINTLPIMDRFVNSIPADSPPAYEDIIRTDPRVSPIDGMPSTTDPSASLNVFSDNEMDCEMDVPGSANISPNVSDNEENRPPPYSETWQPKWGNDTEELRSRDFDLGPFGERKDIRNEAYEDSEYTVDVMESYYNDNFQCQCLNLVVDSRQYTSKLIEWLARHLRLNPDNIVLQKHYNETDTKGFDITLMADESIKSSFSSVSRISVSLRVPTNENEKLIRVVEFDMANDAAVDTWPTLFYVPASEATTFSEFKEKCVTMLENAYAEKIKPKCLRIREITNSGAAILNDSKTFKTRGYTWDNLVCLQKLKQKEASKMKEGINYQAIICRRFCPSTIEIMPPFEVIIPEDDLVQGLQILKKVISEHSNILPERLAFSKLLPLATFARWPFTKSLSELYDTTFGELSALQNDCAGKLIYFV